MKDEFDKTQQLNVDDLVKTIPVICSWCNQIYQIKQWHAEKGVEAGASYGMCPECEKSQLDEEPSPSEEKVVKKEKTVEEKVVEQNDDGEVPFNRTVVLNVEDMMKSIPIVCAWCNKIYHIKAWQVDEGKETAVSHGICPECEKKQQADLETLN